MRRSHRLAALLIPALLAVACAEKSTTPIAASSRAPRPTASVPRGEAMEHEGCVPRTWPPSSCGGGEAAEGGATGEYYFDVDAKGSRFAPASFALSLSEQIELVNHDSVLHNVTIPAAGLSMDVAPGHDDYTRPITLAPGRYEFFCRIHRAAGMRGVFTMTSNKDIITVRRGY